MNRPAALLENSASGKDVAIGKKATPDPLYGISGDLWAGLAVAVTWHEQNLVAGRCRLKLTELSILEVWTAIGGGELRHGRGRAFWRDGDGWNIAIDAKKNVWCDRSRRNEGGGILPLVMLALNCNKAAALAWLEQNCGLDARRPLSIEEKRRYARAAADSEALAVRLSDLARGLELLTEQHVRALDAVGVDPEAIAPYHRQLFILRTAQPLEIARIWRDMPSERESVERVGRQDREHAEAITRVIVDVLSMDVAAELAA